MRMQIPFLFALLAWLGCSGDTPTNQGEVGQPLRVEWQEGDVIVAMGTSLTFGYGSGCRVLPPRSPCSGDSSYPTLLSNELRLPVINLARPRSTTIDGLVQMGEALQLNPVLVILEYGANDLIQGVSLEESRVNLRRMIEGFHEVGSAVVLLSALHPDMIDKTPEGHRLQGLSEGTLAYHAMFVGLADLYGLPVVEYLFEGIWWKRELMFDSLHPNGMGYLVMKENILSNLNAYFVANDLMEL
ncbi:MAG: GDSL-type esterase/lipase family protein [Candidatus Latescibacterota bacterium]|nr:GDSL-type esterase/lipase family protein [Candidatus Latescibacterota bacterium]